MLFLACGDNPLTYNCAKYLTFTHTSQEISSVLSNKQNIGKTVLEGNKMHFKETIKVEILIKYNVVKQNKT